MHGVAALMAYALLCIPTQSAAPAEDVTIRVSVLDPINRYVAGLEKQHFKIHDGKAQQTISYFAATSAPLSLAIVLDTTEMTTVAPEPLRKTLAELGKSGNPADRTTLIILAPRSASVETFSSGTSAVATRQLLGQVLGLSRLDEGLYLGLNHVRGGNAEKKAVVLIGNPADVDVLAAIKPFQECEVQLYSIRGVPIRETTVELTGGRNYNVTHPSELDYYLGLIHSELRHQYILGYRSRQTAPVNGERVSVRVDPPKGAPKMNLRVWKPAGRHENSRFPPGRSSDVSP